MRILLLVVLSAGLAGIARADDRPLPDKAYFCEMQFLAGARYDEQQKKWESARFTPHYRFVLRLKYLEARKNEKLGEAEHYYRVTLTEAGKSTSMPCFAFKFRDSIDVHIGKARYFSCEDGNREYNFNLQTNRFLSEYLFAYIDGKDDGEATPSIGGGVCTPID